MNAGARSEQEAKAKSETIVYIVDDDPDMREALSGLLRSVGLDVVLFASAAEMLQARLSDIPSCLVLDIRLPGINGLDFQVRLANAGIRMPIVFMTGHGDIPMTVRALKAGAIDFLTKPFRDQEMLDAVFAALAQDRTRRESDQAVSGLHELYGTLTAREKEVMSFVTTGMMNKQTAWAMGLSEITVKIHRGRVMRKMDVRSVADLVRAAEKLGLPSTPAQEG